jgi:tRNA dimethylallyltransferase
VPAPIIHRFPIIIGPTAGGKSALAMQIAAALNRDGTTCEIVTADAYQIYTGLDIGTAKPTQAEQALLPHHLLDIIDPSDPTPFTVHDWLTAATRTIAEIQQRGNLPIVVGGTHLYIKALLDGLFEAPPPDEALRASLRSRTLADLRQELERVDPIAASRIHPNDERRTIRALEILHQTGTPISQQQTQWATPTAHTDRVLIGLVWEIPDINRRINARVKGMMEQGLLDEVRALHAAGRLGPQAREALGYKQLIDHLEGRCSLDDAVERIKIETRRFAKNQRTWLKRLRLTPHSVWIPMPPTSPTSPTSGDGSDVSQSDNSGSPLKIALRAILSPSPNP